MRDSQVNRFLGIEEKDLPDGKSRLSLKVRKDFENETGIVHGGVASFLLDGAMGRTVLRAISPEETAATIQLSIQFLRPASGTLSAEAAIIKKGKRVAFVAGECRNEKGEVVALASGSWAIWPSSSPNTGGSLKKN